jgi:ABC-2 type transport system ATP-binding protein
MQYAIETQNVKRSFGKVKALNGLSLRVEPAQVLGLLGPNGAGKTTLVRILSTLLLPTSGSVKVAGFDVTREPGEVRERIGLTGQTAAVDEQLTGEENLRMMGRLYRLSWADARRRAQELLSQFDLQSAGKRQVKTYSGGMRRRLDLAVSLIASPPIIFLDEPTTGLDPRSRVGMWGMVEQLVEAGSTVLLTTQYMDEADRLADKIVVIDKGRMIAEGTADQLKQKVGSERLELTLENADQLKAAQKAIGGRALSVDKERQTISFASKDGVGYLRQVLNQLESAKVKVESISLHQPTLDDVFLSLTGHKARQAKAGQAKKRGKH